MSRTGVRQGTAADVRHAALTLALAFADDPVWGRWAFPDPVDRVERLTAYWEPFAVAALAYDGLFTMPGGEVVAVWVPPGVPELSPADEATLDEVIERLCGERAEAMRQAHPLFEAAHPRDEPHWYLSLLGTHPDHRGRGLGMAMVADHLDAYVDPAGLPAYLESSNDANLDRYRRAGFEPHGTVAMPDGPVLTTMWRPARGS